MRVSEIVKRPACLFLGLLLALAPAARVSAETFYGDGSWRVVFTQEKKMESNFRTADLDEAVGGLQPGDNIIFSLKLRNENETATDWYMTNEVLYSLEDRSANSATGGGAYTYLLAYTDVNGTRTVLFDSDTVGGDLSDEAGEGLHEATDSLGDYFYLDTLAKGQGGEITLEVALDGETQGNDYQDTLADLQMNFAVELNENPTTVTGRDRGTVSARAVKTGDENIPAAYLALMAASGAILLGLAIVGWRKNRKEAEGGGAG